MSEEVSLITTSTGFLDDLVSRATSEGYIDHRLFFSVTMEYGISMEDGMEQMVGSSKHEFEVTEGGWMVTLKTKQ